MNLEISRDELTLLRRHLARELETVEDELVHTDKYELQVDLAADLARLRALVDKIDAQAER
jgi:hypothetical protein